MPCIPAGPGWPQREVIRWCGCGDPMGEPCRTWYGMGAEVSAVAFSPTGDRLASADEGGAIALWQVARDPRQPANVAGESIAVTLDWGMQGRDTPISTLRFNTAGDRVMALDGDGQIYVWDLTGQLLQQWSVQSDNAMVVGMDLHP